MANLREPVPAATVEAVHWGLQRARVQCPVRDGDVAVVTGPLGPRGVYDLPLDDLLDLARSHAAERFAPGQCEQFFGTATCRPTGRGNAGHLLDALSSPRRTGTS